MECGQAAARAALAQKEAEEAIRKAADAEAAAQSAYDRAIFEERRLREAQKQCSEEQIRMKELQAENSRLTDEITLKRKDVLDAQEEAKARRGAIDAAIKAAAADRREAEQQHEAVLRERAILEERIKCVLLSLIMLIQCSTILLIRNTYVRDTNSTKISFLSSSIFFTGL